MTTNLHKIKYWDHKNYTKGRLDRAGNPIEFRLTFVEWFDIWMSSGHYQDRGIRKGQYCMSRHKDLGDYEIGNVSIVPIEQNHSEGHKGVVIPAHVRKAQRESRMKPVHSMLGYHESIKAACAALNIVPETLKRRMQISPSEYYFL